MLETIIVKYPIKVIYPSPLLNIGRIFDGTPRSLHVLNVCPDDPQSILLHADAMLHGVFKLNVFTGKMSEMSETVIFFLLDKLFFDRQGRPGVWKAWDYHSHEWHYLYNTGKGWRDLATMTSRDAVLTGTNFFKPHMNPGEHAAFIGFDNDPNVIYYKSNIGRGFQGISGFNLATGRPTNLAIGDNTLDLADPRVGDSDNNSILVFDRHTQQLAGVRVEYGRRTVWLNPELQAVQRAIEHELPAKDIKILDWNAVGARYLVQATNAYESGVFYFYDQPRQKLVQFARAMPWIEPEMLGEQFDFGFINTEGVRVTGVLTMPVRPRTKNIPVVVNCARIHPERRHVFRPEIFALAAMGYAVVEIDVTQTNGTQSALSGMIFTVLDSLAKQQLALNFKQVFLFGESYAGTTALELLRTDPDRFCGAIAINPVVSDRLYRRIALGETFVSKNANTVTQTRAVTKTKNVPQLIAKPIYMLTARDDRYSNTVRDVYESVRKRGVECAFDTLSRAYTEGDARTKAEIYNRIGNFIYGVITNAKVILGPMHVIEDQKSPAKIPKPEIPQ